MDSSVTAWPITSEVSQQTYYRHDFPVLGSSS